LESGNNWNTKNTKSAEITKNNLLWFLLKNLDRFVDVGRCSVFFVFQFRLDGNSSTSSTHVHGHD